MSRARLWVGFRISGMMACLGLGLSLGLCGCSSVKVGLGWRVSLAKTPVTSMEASMPKGPAVAPGEKSPIVVTFTTPDGKVLVTEGKGKGKVLWKDLVLTPSVVSVSKKGIVSFPRDPRISDGKTGHVSITVASQLGVQAELVIPLRYDYAFVSNFSGSNGTNGTDGINGTDGMSGSMGSTDPDNPSPGGNGTNGTNGSDGQDGERGGDGPSVQIRVTLRSGSHPLLQASVSDGHKERFYLVDPQGGSLTVTSEGGNGGSGGKGGRGGRGGSGGTGSPDGQNGSDGLNGHDGNEGQSGSAGSITVTYDPQVKPFLVAIHLKNPGGPSPVFKEESVAPLW